MFIAVDTETTGLLWSKNDRPYAISITRKVNEELETLHFSANVEPYSRKVEWNTSTLDEVKTYLNDPNTEKVFHNAKFDLHMLKSIGVSVAGEIHDTMIAARCCHTLEPSYSLKNLAQKYLKITDADEKELKKATTKVRNKMKKERKWLCGPPFAVPADYWVTKYVEEYQYLVKRYCNLDTIRTYQLFEFYQEALEELNVLPAYKKEMLLLNMLLEIEGIGLSADKEIIEDTLIDTNRKIIAINREFDEKFGTINLDSPAQLRELLVDKIKIPLIERTEPSKTYPTGQLKTNEKALRKFSNNKWVEKYLERAACKTGRAHYQNYHDRLTEDNLIYASMHQSTTKTFRLSSSDPNLQNVTNPATNDNPHSVDGRCVFGPRSNHIWLCIDYSQLELRVFASRANETKLIEAFRAGRDPHDETRRQIKYLAKKPEKIGRKLAKNTNFTVINCGGKTVLNEKYGIPLHEGSELINGFYEAYPKARARQRDIAAIGAEQGYIRNAYNRRISVDPEFAYRATSYDIQSSAADLMKNAIIRCYQKLHELELWQYVKMLLSIHDELIFEVHHKIWNNTSLFTDVIKMLVRCMEENDGAFQLPTPVEVKLVEKNWSEKREIEL